MLAQAVIMLLTGGVVAWYTFETKRLRESAAGQFEIMWRTYNLQLEEMKRSAEPIFVWGAGLDAADSVEWHFRNEGGAIDHITITMQSPTGAPTGVQPSITPEEWLGNSREGVVTFRGNVSSQFRFTIGFRTRLGGVGGFSLASAAAKPIYAGSGWM